MNEERETRLSISGIFFDTRLAETNNLSMGDTNLNRNELYESKISDARWWIYDIPGNIGWIIYFVCCVRKAPL